MHKFIYVCIIYLCMHKFIYVCINLYTYSGVPKGGMESGPPLFQNIVLELCSKSLKKTASRKTIPKFTIVWRVWSQKFFGAVPLDPPPHYWSSRYASVYVCISYKILSTLFITFLNAIFDHLIFLILFPIKLDALDLKWYKQHNYYFLKMAKTTSKPTVSEI